MGKMTRREFMVKGALIAGGTAGALTLGSELLSPQKSLSAEVEFPTIMKSKMKDKGVPEGDFRNWEAILGWTEKSGFVKLI